ncbi:orotidine-5'-phosphate decarboxylase [bacterium]|nr:orotidine-5'-phosphate decarboxylase [bacterium]
MRDFFSEVRNLQEKNNSILCIGLDPVQEKLPEHIRSDEHSFFRFNKEIIDATLDLVSCYKPNIAFYEARGLKGLESLKKTCDYIGDKVPILLDAKRGDIGHSSASYAKGIFEYYNAGATTVSPYLGYDSLTPFAQYTDRGIFVLALTSNEGVTDFQYLKTGDTMVYLKVAEKVQKWNDKFGNFGLVTGATHPDELAQVRELAPDLPFLIPGIGAQKGKIEPTLKYGVTKKGFKPIVVVARSIIYAGSDKDFGARAREAALNYKSLLET